MGTRGPENGKMGTMDNRGAPLGGITPPKSNLSSALPTVALLVPPPPIHYVSVVSKRLVLVGEDGYGNEEHGEWKMGKMDNRGTPRSPTEHP